MVTRTPLTLIALLLPLSQGAGQTELKLAFKKVSDAELRHPRYKMREVIVEAEPDNVCPENYEKSGTACIQVETAPAHKACLPGWYKGPNDTCVGYTAAIPDNTCVRGSAQYGKCMISNSVPKLLMCPDGFSLDQARGVCLKDLSSQPMRICPPGSQWDKDTCKTTVREPATITCPSGYDLKGRRCEKVTTAALELNCPEGFLLHPIKQKCLKEVRLDPLISCPSPAIMKNGVCTTEESFPVSITCPPGQEMFGNMCISYDRIAPKMRCSGSLQMNPMTNLCEGNEVAEPVPECTKGTFYNPLTQQCGSAFKMKQPNLACPPDFHFAGKRTCVRHVQEMGTKYCPPSYVLESKEFCVLKKQIPALIQCPPRTIQQGNFCITRGTLDQEITCPPDTSLQNNVCAGIIYGRATESCPKGYFGGGGKQNICIKKDTVPAVPRCPEGTSKSEGSDGLICVREAEVPANRYCPPGQRRDNETCIETLTEPVSEACPPGFFEDLQIGRCFTSQLLPSQAVCPVGFKLVGDKCLKQHVRDAELICPPNFERSGPIECTRQISTPTIHQCPFGFEYDGLRGICKTVKVKYEFEGSPVEDQDDLPLEDAPTEAPLEDLKDLEVPNTKPSVSTTSMPATEAEVELQVTRPVVQKGLVVRNEVITLSGPASEVAKKQKLINGGGDLRGDDITVEYAPPSLMV